MPASKTSEPHTRRVALVTGAARGIGQAIAAGLAERGTPIVLGDIDDVSEASDLIGAPSHPAVPVAPDVSDASSIEAAHDADSGLGGFHADVASAKSPYSNVLGWETDDQPIGAFTYTVMRSADAGDEQRSERHHAAQPEMAAARATPRRVELADCHVAAASWEAVLDLVKGICCDPLRASGFCSCGQVRGSLVTRRKMRW